MNNIKTVKNIDSILQVTKDIVNKSNNYYEYIIKHNNLLYIKQLPLLMKNSRISALTLSKTKVHFYENKNNDKNFKIKKIKPQPLCSIRKIQIRSKKLPPLCPLYNDRGELLPSIIKSSKVLLSNYNYFDDNINNINLSQSCEKLINNNRQILKTKKLNIKKLKYNKSCEFDVKINLNEFENNNLNEPEYDKLIYDEKLIFGQRKQYEDIIRKKLKELQSVYNKNFTIKKEKIFNYGLQKKKMHLTLDSLKIKINEIKDEKAQVIEKIEKPVFEYTLPFALLPLYYFKGVDTFLIIITKLIKYSDFTQTFEIAQDDDKIIASILKNCHDFDISDDNINNKKLGENESIKNIMEINDFSPENSYKKNILYRSARNINSINELKNPSLTNSFNNQTSSSVNKSPNQKQNSSDNKDIKNNENNSLNNKNKNYHNSEPIINFKKNLEIKTYDIYPFKINEDFSNISSYEFFWITQNKSYILTIEIPLITVYIPSHKSKVKKYINYDLLFYIYQKQFVMWDFYIMKYLLSFKNFRIFIEQLYSIPEKTNISFFITLPKHKRNVFTSYELTSIVTRETNTNFNPNDNSLYENNSDNNSNSDSFSKSLKNRKRENSKNRKKIKNNKNRGKKIKGNNTNLKKFINSTDEQNQNIESEDIKEFNNSEKLLFLHYHNLSRKNLNFLNFNSIFVQKGLLVIASYINIEKNIINEYTFHFNLDQLRKFQIMEALVDKVSFFIKFLKVNYEQESISFDFESFNSFNEILWIKDMNKYNNQFIKYYKTIYEEKKNEEIPHGNDVSVIRIIPGMLKNTKIKIEIKYPLIIMKALDEFGFKTTEKVNVDNKVEKIMSNLSIKNSLDLTIQLINTLKDNNFCRRLYISNRNNIIKKSTSKGRPILLKDNGILKQK